MSQSVLKVSFKPAPGLIFSFFSEGEEGRDTNKYTKVTFPLYIWSLVTPTRVKRVVPFGHPTARRRKKRGGLVILNFRGDESASSLQILNFYSVLCVLEAYCEFRKKN